jgi:hypothetical protein
MRILNSISSVKTRVGTKAAVHKQASSPYLVGSVYQVPADDVCVSVFSTIKSKLVAPFRGTFRGVIMELQSLDYTQTGNEMRLFKLVDASGHFIQFAAMSQNALSAALVELNEVIVYFATGRGPIGSCGGRIYAYKDAAIVPIGPKFLPANPNQEIIITSKAGADA